jgi:ABC-2 type transport system ATP-binding protein
MTTPFPIDLSGGALAVATHDLSKDYGTHRGIHRLGLQVPAGAVYLLVGPNGAGKSTTIRILLDLVRASAGSAEVLGLDPVTHPALVRANVGYVPEQLTWGYGWMRVGRLLEHHARYFPSWDPAYANRLVKAFDLRMDRRVDTLSKGQGRRVHLAMALAHRPPLLILDEPTDGLDPVMRDETIGVLVEHLADTPTTVLLSTHHVTEVEQIADHIGVLRDGELRAQMTLAELQRGLRRYRGEIPVGWQGTSLFGNAVLRRATTRGQVDWTVWGAEEAIASELANAGATIRDASPLTLHDATLALLNTKESDR